VPSWPVLFLILDVNKIKGKTQSKLRAKFDNYVYPQMKTWEKINKELNKN